MTNEIEEKAKDIVENNAEMYAPWVSEMAQAYLDTRKSLKDKDAENKNTPAGVVLAAVDQEITKAESQWPPFNSAHEGFAVILEEVDELKEHVWTNQKRRDLEAMRKEAIQVAAMAVRFASEVCTEERGRE